MPSFFATVNSHQTAHSPSFCERQHFLRSFIVYIVVRLISRTLECVFITTEPFKGENRRRKYAQGRSKSPRQKINIQVKVTSAGRTKSIARGSGTVDCEQGGAFGAVLPSDLGLVFFARWVLLRWRQFKGIRIFSFAFVTGSVFVVDEVHTSTTVLDGLPLPERPVHLGSKDPFHSRCYKLIPYE